MSSLDAAECPRMKKTPTCGLVSSNYREIQFLVRLVIHLVGRRWVVAVPGGGTDSPIKLNNMDRRAAFDPISCYCFRRSTSSLVELPDGFYHSTPSRRCCTCPGNYLPSNGHERVALFSSFVAQKLTTNFVYRSG